MPTPPISHSRLYRALYLIRRFEESVLENFSRGVFFGTTHTYLGQEANAVGVLANLHPEDIVFSNHRCHGHFLAYGGEAQALFAELMGKASGVCGGRGGSQHLHWRNFYSNGVQGGIVPVATGMALAEKFKASGALGVAFLGDGTLGEGVVYEALNLAALWGAPVLYVVENNHIAQTTPIEKALAGSLLARFNAFGIPGCELDSSDVLEISAAAAALLDDVRQQSAPRVLILHTCRFGPHSKGDDTRSSDELARLRQERDPLETHAPRLDPAERAVIEAEVDADVARAFAVALAAPAADPQGLSESLGLHFEHNAALSLAPPGGHSANVLEALNDALYTALSTDESVYILGEDLLDPYGGAFKVTRRLSSDFPQRVLTTPISEAGFSGAAVGMALRGLRPVVEIMFGDFVTLAADQLVNHAAKFRWMYNGNKLPGEQVHLPLVLRTPMGGRRGYGPTHSQTLEKHLLGVPGLRVLAPTHLGDPRALLLAAILQSEDPTLFVENKLLYLLPLRPALAVDEFELHSLPLPAENAPTYRLALRGAPPPQITVATYGYMAELVSQAALRLAYENELFIEVIVPTQLAPFRLQPVIDSARRTGRLLTVEEGGFSLGWGAEVLAQTAEALGPHLIAARRLAALDLPIPSSGSLEQIVLPGVEQIIESCLKIAQRR